jgi:hypothetical protein
MVEVIGLGNIQMAIAESELQIRGSCKRSAIARNLVQRGVCGFFQLRIVEHQRKWPATGLLRCFTNAPRLENSTRYSAFSTTTVRSCESAMTGIDEAGAAELSVAATVEGVFARLAGGVLAVLLGVSGVVVEVAAGLFCGIFTGGFGAKYFVQPRNTIIDSSDATRIRISGVNLSFFPPLGGKGVIGGVLKSAPRVS